jgi:hypothetical protein
MNDALSLSSQILSMSIHSMMDTDCTRTCKRSAELQSAQTQKWRERVCRLKTYRTSRPARRRLVAKIGSLRLEGRFDLMAATPVPYADLPTRTRP